MKEGRKGQNIFRKGGGEKKADETREEDQDQDEIIRGKGAGVNMGGTEEEGNG